MISTGKVRTLLASALVFAAVCQAADAPTTPPAAQPLAAAEKIVQVAGASFGKKLPATVVLPAGYDDPKNARRTYPLIVLLHGAGGGHRDWAESTDLKAVATAYDRIIVAPTTGPNSWWVDCAGPPANHSETFVAKEMIPALRKTFRIRKTSDHWITGNSMGGWGALRIGLAHPELFSAVGGLSACMQPSRWRGKLDRTWGLTTAMGPAGRRPSLFGPDQVKALAQRKGLRLSLLCGRGDGLFTGENRQAHQALKAAGIRHQWLDVDGKHNWTFWKAYLPKQLAYFQAQSVKAATAAADPPLNQPLECMKHYTFKKFAVAAWCFHTYEGTDYTEQYARNVEAAGFNVAMETGYMVQHYQKTKVKQIVSTMISDELFERTVYGTKRTHPREVGQDIAEMYKKYGKSPSVIGFHVGSKYGKHPMPSNLAPKVQQVEDLNAGLFPWVAWIWDVDAHVKARINIMTLECFRRIKHLGFGYDNKGWPHDKRNSYCAVMEDGRVLSNKCDFAFWPMIPAATISKGHGDAEAGNRHGASEIRFQVLAAIAYGAQGVVYFGYSTAREIWQPNGTSYQAAKEVNKLVTDVIGPRVLGHRSIGVYATRPDAPPKLRVRGPKGSMTPGEGKLIEKMDDGLLAGVLVREADFKSGANTPHYVMLIDARSEPLSQESNLKDRQVSVTFGPQVKAVEVLGAPGEENKQFEREVKVTFKPGDGRLLKLTLAP